MVHEPVLERSTFQENTEANAGGRLPPAFAMGPSLFANLPSHLERRNGWSRLVVVPIVIRVVIIVAVIIIVHVVVRVVVAVVRPAVITIVSVVVPIPIIVPVV